jgi:hypothetical protein
MCPFEQETFEHFLDIEPWVIGVDGAQRNVLQIEKHRHGRIGVLGIHGFAIYNRLAVVCTGIISRAVGRWLLEA